MCSKRIRQKDARARERERDSMLLVNTKRTVPIIPIAFGSIGVNSRHNPKSNNCNAPLLSNPIFCKESKRRKTVTGKERKKERVGQENYESYSNHWLLCTVLLTK